MFPGTGASWGGKSEHTFPAGFRRKHTEQLTPPLLRSAWQVEGGAVQHSGQDAGRRHGSVGLLSDAVLQG